MNFIEKAKLIHNNKYDYSLVEYKNNKTKIKIICNTCKNIFEQRPDRHLKGQGCPICGLEKAKNSRRKTTRQFIEEANLIYGDKYDYSLVEYKNNKTKIKIICNKCKNIFEQIPANHLKNQECCPICNGKKKDLKVFIEKAKLIHNNKYDYSLVEYKNANTKLKIKCNKCNNIFEQIYRKHLQGEGCPNCKESFGEKIIENLLVENNITFEKQKRFKNLKDKKPLSYDFYIPSKNLLIEFNGVQHYKNTFNKPMHEWHRQKHHDWLKRKYAKKNGITLLVIPFWELSKLNIKLLMSK